MSKIQENLQDIQRKVGISKVRIIAVTKYVGHEEIIEAYQVGIRDFAENRIQDAEIKRSKLPEEIKKNSIWHFIGHLQTNKVRKVAGSFEYIHSIDSLKLAECVSEEAKLKGISQKILIQVNVSEEKTKSGFSVKEIKEVFAELLNLKSLDIVGLMTMAPHTSDEQELHSIFKELRELRDYLQKKFNCSLSELSMGMSNDYQIAVLEGATMIRPGSLLFK